MLFVGCSLKDLVFCVGITVFKAGTEMPNFSEVFVYSIFGVASALLVLDIFLLNYEQLLFKAGI
jgi:hypothetical protein